MSPILGIYASQISGHLTPPDTGAMFPLGAVTVGSAGAAEINFTSIPSTYTHLQIRIFGKLSITNDPALENILFQFNGDTGNNYTRHGLDGNGSTVSAYGNADLPRNYAILPRSYSGQTNMFGSAIVDILDYANTNKFKTQKVLAGADLNGSGQIALISGVWRNTNAISSIKIFNFSPTTFIQYSSFALYGIKGA